MVLSSHILFHALNPFPSHLSQFTFIVPRWQFCFHRETIDNASMRYSQNHGSHLYRCYHSCSFPFVYVMSQCVSTHQAVVLIRSRAMLSQVLALSLVQQKFNKLLIFSMNQGKMEFWKCVKLNFIFHIFLQQLCQIQNLATENRFRCFLSSLFHLSQKIQKIQNDVSLRICYDKKQYSNCFLIMSVQCQTSA